MSDPTAAEVGRRVQELRAARGLSLSALARTAGIGKASLSELEQGRRNPTLATLYALAGPLGVPLVALVGEAPGTTSGDGALSARLLHVDHAAAATTEVYWIELVADARRDSPAHAAGVREHVHVVRGELGVTVDGRTSVLRPGDSLAWAADLPHTYAAGPDGAAAVDTITSPASASPASASPASA
ncbi:helix-turn-helix domain-containing protein [Nocardioides zeae]|uniref:Helix-turn-helix domain-containing protein n=1 Tax=Nocardioides imazamoxiresistens TaxID=3231893 RepID=A0ABU3PRH9_9ACTN|nr:helix-turn-helix domain-containing protein [Nocardioides zeae]MDT9591824.1 helix-turn-helix domain-containing protein [Nocardioides zeae]